MKCPCDNCILYAMCRTKLIDMNEAMDGAYTRIVKLANDCILLNRFIYGGKEGDPWFHTDRRTERTQLTWKLFKIKKRDLDWGDIDNE